MKQTRYIFIFLLFLSLIGCFRMPEAYRDIADIRNIPQDHAHFIDPDVILLTEYLQKEMNAKYDRLYFGPWHLEKTDLDVEVIKRPFEKYAFKPGFGENKRRHDASWANELLILADLDHYPNAGFNAITTNNTDLRTLPTCKPIFSHAGGYPFDRLQKSLIAVNTPLYITHMTLDKAWFFAETPHACGWIASRDVAAVSSEFIEQWERKRYTVVIRDKTSLYDEQGHFLCHAPLGAMFPAVGDTGDAFIILFASADLDRIAVIRKITITKDAASYKPLPMTGANMIRVADELIKENYGWGGMYKNRDCSAMLKDLYAPFGIWLSRHSSDQAKRDGFFIDLSAMSAEEKKRSILEQGIPYLTLLWMRGHIMLYIGRHLGEPLVFHNFWSVRTEDFLGRPERQIVGHAAITTLHPGRELRNASSPKGDYLPAIQGMTLLSVPFESE
ncbi:MAG: SH3 domain-containing protein [Syntrophaceae bacterium]|nr:SH3 domain-containing protein [Syntrophaceae bacterium]